MKDMVSVVIPVYNTKDYLEKCMKSVLNQTHQALEIILVDDGSTDGSAELCNQLAELDKRVTIIHKKNGGVVSARLAGLEKATGKYAILIDSDDWIEAEMIAELYKVAVENDADIVTSGFYKENDGIYGIVIDGVKEGIYSSFHDKKYLFENLKYCGTSEKMGVTGSLCCKLIKSRLLREVHIDINNCIAYAEDAAVVYSSCVRAETIVVTHKIYYHYVMRIGSSVYRSNLNYFANINKLFLFLKKEFEKSEFHSILMKQLNIFMISLVFQGLSYFADLDESVAIPYYDFDKTKLERGAKLVLYGAGRVGKSFYKQIQAERLYQLVGWVDKEYTYYQNMGLDVVSPEQINEWDYDCILLALKFEDLAQTVKKELENIYGIDREKIIWLKPINIIDKYNILI